jgi:hypothetical protein
MPFVDIEDRIKQGLDELESRLKETEPQGEGIILLAKIDALKWVLGQTGAIR